MLFDTRVTRVKEPPAKESKLKALLKRSSEPFMGIQISQQASKYLTPILMIFSTDHCRDWSCILNTKAISTRRFGVKILKPLQASFTALHFSALHFYSSTVLQLYSFISEPGRGAPDAHHRGVRARRVPAADRVHPHRLRHAAAQVGCSSEYCAAAGGK